LEQAMTKTLHPRAVRLRRYLTVLFATGVGVLSLTSHAQAMDHVGPQVSHLARIPGGLGSGSTIGPDGALYVSDGTSGSVDRMDPHTGGVSVYASGLPPRVLQIGGAVDVAFIGRQAYALVTMVGGDFVGGPHIGDAAGGIYRLDGHGRVSLVADIGAWSVVHPPTTSYFITTGVQYAMEVYRGEFLVSDGHHNRVLRVTLDGRISQFATFGNVVPTGLEVAGSRVLVSQAGPVPHLPESGRILALSRHDAPHEVARGARLLVDVEIGPRHQLYGLSQGHWDGEMEGSPALPNTGRLDKVEDGTLTPVTDTSGTPLVLDRPTSVDFVGHIGYVVSLTGDVYTVAGL
jgi:hypothetical protein